MVEATEVNIGTSTAVAQVLFASVFWIGLESGFQSGAAVWAAKQAGEKVDPFWTLGFFDGFMAKDDSFPVRPADIGGAIVLYALEGSCIDFVSGGTGPGTVVACDAVFFITVYSGFANGVVIQDIVPEVLKNRGRLRVLDAALDTIDHLGFIAIWPFVRTTCKAPLLTPTFAVKDELDALTGAIRFILGHAEHDVDLQAAVSGGGVVILHSSLPGDMVGLQDLLNLVVLPDVAEPPVQLDKKNSIQLPRLHVSQELLHDGPLHGRFPGAVAFIPVNSDDLIAVILSILGKDFLLSLQAVALQKLLFSGNSWVDADPENICIRLFHFCLAFPGQIW